MKNSLLFGSLFLLSLLASCNGINAFLDSDSDGQDNQTAQVTKKRPSKFKTIHKIFKRKAKGAKKKRSNYWNHVFASAKADGMNDLFAAILASHYETQREAGKSPAWAIAYADQKAFGSTEDFAINVAKHYEAQRKKGKSPTWAIAYAKQRALGKTDAFASNVADHPEALQKEREVDSHKEYGNSIQLRASKHRACSSAMDHGDRRSQNFGYAQEERERFLKHPCSKNIQQCMACRKKVNNLEAYMDEGGHLTDCMIGFFIGPYPAIEAAVRVNKESIVYKLIAKHAHIGMSEKSIQNCLRIATVNSTEDKEKRLNLLRVLVQAFKADTDYFDKRSNVDQLLSDCAKKLIDTKDIKLLTNVLKEYDILDKEGSYVLQLGVSEEIGIKMAI